MRMRWLWVVSPLVVVGACSTGASSGQSEGSRAVSLALLAQGTYSAIESPRFEVIRDAAAFRSLWMQHVAAVSPAPPIPDVDFSKDMVIAAFAGIKNTGGYSLSISHLSSTDGRLEARLRLSEPGPTCIVPQAITQPYVIVRTATTPAPVSFRLSTTTSPCNPDR
jgi:protease stability complex PrcB-like protein